MTSTTIFQGLGILCFYTNGLFQGHLIQKDTNHSPFSLAGKLLPDHVDPLHNDCMELQDFYKVLIQPHAGQEHIELTLRRQKKNDAGGLSTHENDINEDGYQFEFETHHFITGQQALSMKNKYFPNSTYNDESLIVCIGDVLFEKTSKEE